MHNAVICYFYTLQSKSSYHLSPQLSWYYWLYSLCCIFHVHHSLLRNYSFLPTNPFLLLYPNTYTLLLWKPPASFLYLRVCFSLVSFVLFFRFYISEIIWYLSFSYFSLIISPSLIPTGSIHVITKDFVHFYGWIIFHWSYKPHLLYSPIYCWTLRILP